MVVEVEVVAEEVVGALGWLEVVEAPPELLGVWEGVSLGRTIRLAIAAVPTMTVIESTATSTTSLDTAMARQVTLVRTWY